MPKISAPDVRAVGEAAGTDAWWLGWARWFATQLGKSPNSPLFPAPWWLEPVRGQATRRPWFDPSIPQPAGWRATLDDLGVHEVEPLQANQILALRPPSAANTDRVKVWRKHARAGTLPPVLLWFLPSALDVFLVLDGHDRLQAAAAEKVEPRFLKLASAENVEQPTRDLQAMMSGIERALASPNSRMKDTTSLNTMLIDAHRTSSRRLCARAWPMKGKAAAWEKEVRAVARALGVSPEIVGMLDAAP